jgi:DMSO/TMAO reductase YedYZ molybdopterin-dependent catalytic subunit
VSHAPGSDAVTLDPQGVFRRIPLKPHQLTADVTPVEECFVLAHLGIARLDPERWRLSIGGLVREKRVLSLRDVLEQPKREIACFFECAGNPLEPTVAQRRIVNVVWGGVSVRDVLASAGVNPAARYLWSYGADKGAFADTRSDAYAKDLPLERAAAGDVLLAYELNGRPLSALQGFPLRLVVPGWYGTNNVKWLTRLQLAARRWSGPFTTRFYADPVPGKPEVTRPVWEVAPESVIVWPAPGAELRADAEVEVWGRAWGSAEIVGVEVSIDAGATWRDAAIGKRHEWSWQRFRLRWRPGTPGATTLLARATDSAGATQPMSGARNAVQSVEVTVTPSAAARSSAGAEDVLRSGIPD